MTKKLYICNVTDPDADCDDCTHYSDHEHIKQCDWCCAFHYGVECVEVDK